MSTRGVVGIRIKGVDKLSYNHNDSYPEGLGLDVLQYCRNLMKNKQKLAEEKRAVEAADRLVVVREDEQPTPEFIKRHRAYLDTDTGTGTPADMYCLLRGLQGNLPEMLKAGVMLDGADFIKHSLFCEWGYVVNFDDMTLEVYEGSQEHRHKSGRYASSERDEDGYYPCALTLSVALSNLPTDELFCSALRNNCSVLRNK